MGTGGPIRIAGAACGQRRDARASLPPSEEGLELDWTGVTWDADLWRNRDELSGRLAFESKTSLDAQEGCGRYGLLELAHSRNVFPLHSAVPNGLFAEEIFDIAHI